MQMGEVTCWIGRVTVTAWVASKNVFGMSGHARPLIFCLDPAAGFGRMALQVKDSKAEGLPHGDARRTCRNGKAARELGGLINGKFLDVRYKVFL